MSENRITGSGGGGGGGGKGGGSRGPQAFYAPNTASDTLNSTAFANVIDVLCEGEIGGLVNGDSSIFINNTPLYGSTYNFKNVTVATRNGTQGQSFVPGDLTNPAGTGEAIFNEVPVNQNIDADFPIIRTITDENVDAVRLTISFPALQQQQSNGDIVGSNVQLRIAIQQNGGGFTTVLTDTVAGRTGDTYQRTYTINIADTTFPVDVRVTRLTADSTAVSVVDRFEWTSYTEFTYARLAYPNTAYIAMRLDAAQFNSIPSRSYLIKGLKIRVPSNATADGSGRLTFSGAWNGSFSAPVYSNCPAWCLYDLLTSRRYGFGDFILTDAEKASFTGSAANLDKYAFYAASVYCNELVPDGFGGTEPRFSCNVNIQSETDAYELINQMASIFRAMPYWSAGSVSISQDAPASPVYLFTNANISEDGFNYVGSSQKTRANVVTAKYFDIDARDYLYESVEDRPNIAKYGATPKTIEAFGCTSRGQARRLAEWMLYSENLDTEVVNFTTSLGAGVVVRPGSVISVMDSLRAGARRGGRVVSASSSTIVVDQAIAVSGTATVSVIVNGALVTRTISATSGSTIIISGTWGVTVPSNAIWVVESSTLQTSLWRVISVTEQDGINYAIAALSYNASKYNYIERGVPLTARNVTNLDVIPANPTNFAASENVYTQGGISRNKIIVTFSAVEKAQYYQIEWRKDYSNWKVETVYGPAFEVLNTTAGLYEFKVSSVAGNSRLCASPLTGALTAVGKATPPQNISGFTYTLDPDLGLTLSWSASTDADFSRYEIRRGSSWSSSTLVTELNATSYFLGTVDPANYTYLIKAVDLYGVYSITAASVTVTISAPNVTTITATLEDPQLRLTWTKPAVTSYNIKEYVVSVGNSYASSTQLTVTSSLSYVLKADWSGSRTFWVAVRDISNRTNATPASVSYTVTASGAPSVSGSFSVDKYILSWTAVKGTLATAQWSIRYGSTYATSTELTKIAGNSLTTTVVADWLGSRNYYVAPIDGNGTVGSPGSVAANIVLPPAPSVTSSIVNGTLTLKWTAVKGTLDTKEYQIRYGSVFASATKAGTVTATTYSTPVKWSGTRKYWVAAVDVRGNLGAGGGA